MAVRLKITKEFIQEVSKSEFKTLILEESTFIRKALKSNLVKVGFKERNIYESGNGEDGFSFLMEIEGLDFIIVDLSIPKINGFDFIQSVKKNSAYKHVHVIAMSKEDSIDADSTILHKYGVYEIIAKPFSQDEFLNLFVPKVQKMVKAIKPKDEQKQKDVVKIEPKKEVKEDNSQKIIDELRIKVEALESELNQIKKEIKIEENTKLLSYHGLKESLEDYERLFVKFKERQNYMLVSIRMDKLDVVYANFGEAMINNFAKVYSNILKKLIIGDNVSSYLGNGRFMVAISVNDSKELNAKLALVKKIITSLKATKLTIKEKQIALSFSCGIAIRSKCGSLKNTLAKVDEKVRVAIKKGGNKIEV